jgi:hypothetical protein
MTDRYPGYDVLAKRRSPSWNDQTRQVIDARMALDPERHDVFDDDAFRILQAVCERIAPQPPDRVNRAPLAAMIDQGLAQGAGDGYRDARMPPAGEAWRRGLQALDAEARARHGRAFHALSGAEQDGILIAAQHGYLDDPAWAGMPPRLFFESRVIHDVVEAYYSHPAAWNEIGYGGPAAPRGYVRVDMDRRDPWEASEARPGREEQALRENVRAGRS